ncbi:TVP38/TMEM64 family protein [Alkalilimnicola ehrlichii MLHE-1]|uniref:TVP38/TMEM64 family membrane protein n=1 Tax=Alkalilimnicola ehrlichii (strain ATCC BAA-1101 / DSM 17681 / MLHE-1) TaxID=187272 RepID=Q0A8X4_ALKEH|nr:VTT domain-containing protein [Alkalilimnicola ehrlichii]ABI56713.1 phospholipase D/transphosphatidylase [Alkalilimnicola ehrlichii MLHE-1]
MRPASRPHLLLGLLLAVGALALLWFLLSPGEGWHPDRVQALGQRFADTGWFPWLVFALIVVAQQLALPHLVLVALSVILLGAWQGFVVAYTATVFGALLGYLAGRLFGEGLVQRHAGPRIERLNRALARHGVRSVILVNLFPLLPHIVINLVAGTTRLRFHDFLLGTAAGLLPSTLVIMVITQVLLHYARMPTAGEAFWALLVTALMLLGAWGLGRYLWRRLEDDG